MQFHINKFSRSASSDPTARTPPSPCLPLCSCHCHSSSSAALLSTTANATGSHLLRSSLSFGVLSSPPSPPPSASLVHPLAKSRRHRGRGRQIWSRAAVGGLSKPPGGHNNVIRSRPLSCIILSSFGIRNRHGHGWIADLLRPFLSCAPRVLDSLIPILPLLNQRSDVIGTSLYLLKDGKIPLL